MKVEHISNSLYNTNFQGGINIVGDLSAIPARQVKNSVPKLKQLFENKNYDLFITQDYAKNKLIFRAQKSGHFGKKNNPYAETFLSAARVDGSSDLYYSVAKYVAKKYEKLPENNTFGAKCKDFFAKLGRKFMQIMQDE